MGALKGKTVVLGVTGCIAAYKAAEIVRSLVRSDAQVKVVMTKAATQFVSPLTFSTLSRNQVTTGLFENKKNEIHHISLADEADVILVAPATANILAKVANGIADDALTTTILACEKSVVFAPAMNSRMHKNPATQKNIAVLKQHGYHIIEPEEGDLACGETGIGRLAAVNRILEVLEGRLQVSTDLEGAKVLVTAGGTEEPIDPIRFIGNRSSGRMGYALAEAAVARGAQVMLVAAPTALPVPGNLEFVPVRTAKQMRDVVMKKFEQVDVVIKAAAVADFELSQVSKEKIKKKNGLTLKLIKTPDILAELGKLKKGQLLVGFAAESENLIANAKEKLKNKNLDLVVANDISNEDFGVGKEINQVTIIDKLGRIEELPVMRKQEIAHAILDRVSDLLKSNKKK